MIRPADTSGRVDTDGPPSTASDDLLVEARRPWRVRSTAAQRSELKLVWWHEVAIVAAFYFVYTAIRDINGTKPVSAATALANAKIVISFERHLGVFVEQHIQHFFLQSHFAVEVLDVWYGTTHFLVTGALLLILFYKFPDRYRVWRDTLAILTALALIGFAVFPEMPPRLFPASYGFVDTLRVIGGLWNFNSGPMNDVSNQYAAMPSLHFAWALWCGLALAAMLKRRWTRFLAYCYPAVTFVCVIVTANHLFADVVAGGAITALGYGGAVGLQALRSRRYKWS
ncbi:MAG: phosphatase PAP2 family protein [Acidimicrobiales bacterium]